LGHAEEHVLSVLRTKRDDIRDMIAAYEKRIADAKRDLLNYQRDDSAFRGERGDTAIRGAHGLTSAVHTG
jgi:hypothetical protein